MTPTSRRGLLTGCPPISILPLLTGSRPASIMSRVVLPHPDAPRMEMNCRAGTSMLTLRSTSREAPSRLNALATLRIRTSPSAEGAIAVMRASDASELDADIGSKLARRFACRFPFRRDELLLPGHGVTEDRLHRRTLAVGSNRKLHHQIGL